MPTKVELVADLIRQRNAIDRQIAEHIRRPVVAGHLGEWIASEIFGIELARSASSSGGNGRFRDGALAGRSVDVHWHTTRDGLLNLKAARVPDLHLVMTGPKAPPSSSRGTHRPLLVDFVYLFDGPALVGELRRRDLKIGVASSVRNDLWDAAEIYPAATNSLYTVSRQQIGMLRRLGSQTWLR